MSRDPQQSISVARSIALEVLRRVEAEDAYSSLALNQALGKAKNLLTSDRKLITELVYGTLRWRMKLDHALSICCHRPLQKIEPVLLRILRMSAYQLLFLDRIPDWAAVDQASALARKIRGKSATGLINAVLRKLAGSCQNIEWPDIQKDPIMGMAIAHSFPTWMVETWIGRFGIQRADQLMRAFNQPPPLWIRANTLKGNPDDLHASLTASGCSVNRSEILPDALILKIDEEIGQMPIHRQGWFHVQDAAAQAVCALLDPSAGQRVLDACGAPGGKAATIAELMNNQGEILSADIHPGRLRLTEQLIDRLGLSCIKTIAYDLTKPIPAKWGLFDAALIDGPCSSLGTLRRHPERKWKSTKTDSLIRTQRSLLDSVARAIKPGGVLVYSICTLTDSEGPKLIDNWLMDHDEFSRHDSRSYTKKNWHGLLDEKGDLTTWPDRDNMDAFYAARLIKKK